MVRRPVGEPLEIVGSPGEKIARRLTVAAADERVNFRLTDTPRTNAPIDAPFDSRSPRLLGRSDWNEADGAGLQPDAQPFARYPGHFDALAAMDLRDHVRGLLRSFVNRRVVR
jgi:hypothetical protein